MAKAKKETKYFPRANLDSFHRVFDGTPKTLVFVDTETEGLNFKNDKIIQFAGIKCRWENDTLNEIESIDQYINPQRKLNPEIVKLTKITDSMLSQAPTEEDAFPKIKAFLEGADCFLAYNAPFDYEMVNQLFWRQNNSAFKPKACIDILQMVHPLISTRALNGNKKQESVARYLQVLTSKDASNLHNALTDIKLSMRIFSELYRDYAKRTPPQDNSYLDVPVIKSHWEWVNDKTGLMARIYFQTDKELLYFDKFGRYFGVSPKNTIYTSVNDINMEGFIRAVYERLGARSLEDLAHWKSKSKAKAKTEPEAR